MYLPRAAPWRLAFAAELLSFPAGKHDDQVDALGLVGQLLDKMVPGRALKPVRAEPEDRWAKVFAQHHGTEAAFWRVV